MSKVAVILFAALASLVSVHAGQDLAPPSQTEWGDPAIEGIWLTANRAGLPFERPDGSDAGLLAQLVEGGAIERVSRLDPARASERERDALAEWKRSHDSPGSLLIDPSDGRMPAVTPEARVRAARLWQTSVSSMGPWAGPSNLGPLERCISRGPLGSMLPSMDYSAIEIVQAPGLVAIRVEAIHETRVIPVSDFEHLPPAIRSYMGDSRGSWNGDTLVIETRNVNGKTGALAGGNEIPTSEALAVTETFRVSAGALHYEMRVSDPGTWVAPWTVAYPLTAAPDYEWSEYACHEGNYAMRNLLSVSRAAEQAASPRGPKAQPARPARRSLPPLPQRPRRPAPQPTPRR